MSGLTFPHARVRLCVFLFFSFLFLSFLLQFYVYRDGSGIIIGPVDKYTFHQQKQIVTVYRYSVQQEVREFKANCKLSSPQLKPRLALSGIIEGFVAAVYCMDRIPVNSIPKLSCLELTALLDCQ